MKRYSISWKNEDTKNEDIKNVEVIASTFTKAINYCQAKINDFIPDNIINVSSRDNILIAE